MERLTNEQAKQEAIKKAYGEHWDLVKDFVGFDGWILCINFHYYQNMNGMSETPIINIFGKNDSCGIELIGSYEGKRWRPKCLFNIDRNNGWTRIEPDGSNFPIDESVRYKAGTLCDNGDFIPHSFHFAAKEIKYLAATHYKPIEKELLPIY